MTKRKLKTLIAGIALCSLFLQNLPLLLLSAFVLAILDFKKLTNLKVLIFFGIFSLLVFMPYIFIRSNSSLYYSGLIMLRAVILSLGVFTIAENINLSTARDKLTKIFGRKFAVSLTLAFNLLPIFKQILHRTFGLFYLKNKCGLPKYKQFLALALAIFKQTIEAAECCAENMLLTHKTLHPKIMIITAPKHSGKTTFAHKLIAEFKAKNWPVTGFIAPGNIRNDRRLTINIEDIASGEKKILASRIGEVTDGVYEYGDFVFSKSGLQFAKEALLQYKFGGIVFLDEYGPLEFANLGFAADFRLLCASNVAAIFVVVRENLLTRFLEEHAHLSCEILKINAYSTKAKLDNPIVSPNLYPQSSSLK